MLTKVSFVASGHQTVATWTASVEASPVRWTNNTTLLPSPLHSSTLIELSAPALQLLLLLCWFSKRRDLLLFCRADKCHATANVNRTTVSNVSMATPNQLAATPASHPNPSSTTANQQKQQQQDHNSTNPDDDIALNHLNKPWRSPSSLFISSLNDRVFLLIRDWKEVN